MGDKTGIEWCDATWNPTKGCSRVSEGCRNCYAESMAARIVRMAKGKPTKYDGLVKLVDKRQYEIDAATGEPTGNFRTISGPRWTGEVLFDVATLAQPLKWAKPRRIFVNSMSDLFHEKLSNEQIAAVFGVMAACPQHTFQVLTKRPKRMREWFARDGVEAEVEKFRQIALAGRIEEYFASERVKSIADFAGYFITSRGRVLSSSGREFCAWCGEPNVGGLRKKYCSLKCKAKANYELQSGRWVQPAPDLKAMSPDVSEQGHMRVQFYRDGGSEKLLVHRLVLEAFDRPSRDGEQGCHIDGDATNNALWNLRWGSQSSNWEDRKRHGNRRSYTKVTEGQVTEIRRLAAEGQTGAEIGRRFGISDTQVRNIAEGRQWTSETTPAWPLPGVWIGVSVEDQAAADERIPKLLQTPAAVRFLSCEPLLGEVDLRHVQHERTFEVDALTGDHGVTRPLKGRGPKIDLVIAGCESGPGARPCEVEWLRSLRDQCATAGVSFFLKQAEETADCGEDGVLLLGDSDSIAFGDGSKMKPRRRNGNHIIGAPYLDGVQHLAFPEVTRAR